MAATPRAGARARRSPLYLDRPEHRRTLPSDVAARGASPVPGRRTDRPARTPRDGLPAPQPAGELLMPPGQADFFIGDRDVTRAPPREKNGEAQAAIGSHGSGMTGIFAGRARAAGDVPARVRACYCHPPVGEGGVSKGNAPPFDPASP